jgi:hypothetical protein
VRDESHAAADEFAPARPIITSSPARERRLPRRKPNFISDRARTALGGLTTTDASGKFRPVHRRAFECGGDVEKKSPSRTARVSSRESGASSQRGPRGNGGCDVLRLPNDGFNQNKNETMTISSTTGSAAAYTPPPISSDMKQRMQDFQSLSQALQSGDLSSAQSAFATLQSNLTQNSSGPSPFSDPNSQASKDLAAVGTALKSGDVSGAQDAMATLQKDMKAARGGHHHHHAQAADSTSSTDSTTASEFETLLNAATTSATSDASNSASTNTNVLPTYA